MLTLHDAPLAKLDATTAYRLLALRSAVFVVEQECAYLDPDGRDLEPDAVQLWAERAGEIVSTLRLLRDPDGSARIGRVATVASVRGSGIAARLMARALELTGAREVVLDAQSYLQGWYEQFGFTAFGPEFLDDGIPHVPMRRPARQDGDHADVRGAPGQ